MVEPVQDRHPQRTSLSGVPRILVAVENQRTPEEKGEDSEGIGSIGVEPLLGLSER